MTSAADKTQVKTNEALNLVVKIEGRGNVSAIGEPRVAWPAGVEVYDTKSKSNTGRAGVGEKLFEYVLIPQPGKRFRFLRSSSRSDPVKRIYYLERPEPLTLQAPASDRAMPNAQTFYPGGVRPQVAPNQPGSSDQPACSIRLMMRSRVAPRVKGWWFWVRSLGF